MRVSGHLPLVAGDREGADLGPSPAAAPRGRRGSPLPEAPFARPVDAVDRVLARDGSGIRIQWAPAPDEPFFHGHYPGQPILPGAFIIEAVHQAVWLFVAEDDLWPRLEEIRRARFLAPVRPADVLECDCRCARVDNGRGLEVDARCLTGAGLVAQVRLLYRLEGTDA